MKIALPLAALAAFSIAAPALALDSNAAASAEAKDEEAKEAKVCRIETITGSRLAKRKVCRTAEEWRKYEQDTSDNFEQARRRVNDAAGNQ
ncbi:hypothetical protein GRI43_04840 [Altererythrobacter luteolus]|uniref:Uncharacterized protein n=1 Tax=Pontixanthobacter luteolus TaxID=295089 RepID=A0A6I4V0E5_9SPHN|nr:hypothetical protein [Pontixanthobacter luteolus]MXP46721.1 hypothetical protein [Pontixanthobacter luteolus]